MRAILSILRTPAFVALGMLVGFVVFLAINNGYFIQWQRLPKPPQDAVELVTSREFTLYVRTLSNDTYSWHDDAWAPEDIPSDIGRGWTIVKPCRYAWPEFSPFSNPPAQIVDCVQDYGVYAEYGNTHAYVLDKDGNIWVWARLTHVVGALQNFLGLTCLGGIVGLVISQIALRREARRQVNSASRAEELSSLSPHDFEAMVVELYRLLGHKAKRTGATSDQGADVIVEAKNGEKWIVQCKSQHGSVDESTVRDFYDMVHHEKADQGAIITTGTFTAQARDWAKGKPLTLLEGKEFLNYLKRARMRTTEKSETLSGGRG